MLGIFKAKNPHHQHKMGREILLLENINSIACEILHDYKVTRIDTSMGEEDLLKIIDRYDVIGIRSKTQITKKILEKATKLKIIACFCIGTDQVDIEEARKRHILVLNSPFGNTRSVAELVICEIIALSRKLFDTSTATHHGIWQKTDQGCFEIRGKTLGIIGYGNVGTQVGILAEAFGMYVLYYDVERKLQYGNAQPCSFDFLLENSDFVTIHVPKNESTNMLVSNEQLSKMKKGSYLLNLSRGSVVNLEDLYQHLVSKHLAGCAIDVYPQEPSSNGNGFHCHLQNLPNVILTPHIGGSTQEAQQKIAVDVASKIVQYLC